MEIWNHSLCTARGLISVRLLIIGMQLALMQPQRSSMVPSHAQHASAVARNEDCEAASCARLRSDAHVPLVAVHAYPGQVGHFIMVILSAAARSGVWPPDGVHGVWRPHGLEAGGPTEGAGLADYLEVRLAEQELLRGCSAGHAWRQLRVVCGSLSRGL